MPATFETLVHECNRCDGKGILPHYGHISGGICFACKGSGKLSQQVRVDGTVKISLEVFKRDGEFDYASHRQTILTDNKEWGKCLLADDSLSVEDARNLWADLKGNANAHLSVTNICDGKEDTKVYQSWRW